MEQYTLPIMCYTNEIWDILYPEASKDEWSWMSNVHSSADAAIIQMQMARQSAQYPKKLGKVQFVVIDQEFFSGLGMTIREWGAIVTWKKIKRHAEVFSSVDGVGHAAALGKEPYGSGSSDVCLPIPDGKYVTKFV
ncbi:MAG: hypothetical protein ACLUD0_11685 [Eubacterium ramulus]